MGERNSSGDVILALVLGGIIGATAGILFAPASGKETRKKLKNMSDDLEEKAEGFVGEAKEKVAHFAHDAREKAEGFAGEVRSKAEHFAHDAKEKVLDQKDRLEAAFDAGRKAYDKKTSV
jgi:gas vesicle protein